MNPSVVRCDLFPGRSSDLTGAVRSYAICETASRDDGCSGLYLASPDDDANAAHVAGMWDDETSLQRWLEHPERNAAAGESAGLIRIGRRRNRRSPGRGACSVRVPTGQPLLVTRKKAIQEEQTSVCIRREEESC